MGPPPCLPLLYCVTQQGLSPSAAVSSDHKGRVRALSISGMFQSDAHVQDWQVEGLGCAYVSLSLLLLLSSIDPRVKQSGHTDLGWRWGGCFRGAAGDCAAV